MSPSAPAGALARTRSHGVALASPPTGDHQRALVARLTARSVAAAAAAAAAVEQAQLAMHPLRRYRCAAGRGEGPQQLAPPGMPGILELGVVPSPAPIPRQGVAGPLGHAAGRVRRPVRADAQRETCPVAAGIPPRISVPVLGGAAACAQARRPHPALRRLQARGMQHVRRPAAGARRLIGGAPCTRTWNSGGLFDGPGNQPRQ